MKLLRPTLALMIVVAVASMAQAQTGVRGTGRTVAVPPNPQALAALQTDLVNAIESMKSALPIYDGNRVHSIRAAHEALIIVDHAISGANAMKRQVPNVKDQVSSGQAHTQYTAQQIAASQASMRKGYAALQQAYKDLQAAAGSNPNAKALKVNAHLQTAGTEATKAIAIHAAQG